MVQHGLFLFVEERHVLEIDDSLHVFQFCRVLRVHDLRHRLDHLAEAPEARHALLKHLGKLDEHVHGIDKDRNIQRVDREILAGELSFRDEEAARDQHGHIHEAFEEIIPCVEDRHRPVVRLPGAEKSEVRPLELLLLDRLAGERLHDADAAEGVLQRRIDPGHFLPVIGERRLHAFILTHGKDRHADHDRRETQRQRRVDPHQQDERSDDLDHGDKDVLRSVMRELRDVEQVRHELAHHLAGVVLIVIREGQCLVPVEQVAAHLRLDTRSHHVALVSNVPPAQRTDQVHAHEHGGYDPQPAENDRGRLQKQRAAQDPQELRKRQIDHRQDRRTEQIEEKHAQIRLIVRYEFANQVHSLPPLSGRAARSRPLRARPRTAVTSVCPSTTAGGRSEAPAR